MKQGNSVSFIAWRFYLILFVILLVVAGLTWRVFSLAVLEQHFLRQQGDDRVLRLVSTPAFRGMIVDRHGFPLAISTTVYSAWMNPKEFSPSKNEVKALAKALSLEPKEMLAVIKRYRNKKREFIYLKRSLSPEVANQIKALHVPGIYLQQEYRRYYPEGEAASHVIGFTNVDDQGQEGIELAYNHWLMGEPGKKWVVKDRIGRVISDIRVVSDQVPGRDLQLSIDRRIQYLAYRELVAGILQYQALSGSAIVLDIKTGEILAMVNFPSFNPNNRASSKPEYFRNRAVTDTFEPGSTIKAFTVASALESGRFTADSIIDTSPGWMRVGRDIVRDKKNNGQLSLMRILQVSSNMGATKMVLALPPNQLWDLLHRVGFGEVTGVGFPGEQNGSLVKHNPWGAFMLATLSFGYGLSATTLQLTRAYAVLAADGLKLPVSLLKLEQAPVGERVLNPEIARQMLVLLESVVGKGGTGTSASVPGFRVAGKTGTTWKLGEKGGYDRHRYLSSFIGIAPVSRPRVVVAIVIHDPQGKKFYGGDVAGPVFEKIMEGTLRILDLPPDAPLDQKDTKLASGLIQ